MEGGHEVSDSEFYLGRGCMTVIFCFAFIISAASTQ